MSERLSFLDEGLEERAGDARALLELGRESDRQGWGLKAISALQQAAAIGPDQIEALLALAHAYFGRNLRESALEMLTRVFRKDPGNPGAVILYEFFGREMPEIPPLATLEGDRKALAREAVETCLQELSDQKDRIRQELEAFADEPDDLLAMYRKQALEKRALVQETLCEIGGEVLASTALPEPSSETEQPGELAEERTIPLTPEAKSALEPIFLSLRKTKGVSEVFLFDLRGEVLFSLGGPGQITPFVGSLSRALGRIQASSEAGPLSYWVVEYERGLVVSQLLAGGRVLGALGEGGTNFGALKYGMDKNRPQIIEILTPQ